jgi:hypothetical protein
MLMGKLRLPSLHVQKIKLDDYRLANHQSQQPKSTWMQKISIYL